MSTNTNANAPGFLDASALEKLANEFFAALPDVSQGAGAPSEKMIAPVSNNDVLLQHGDPVDMSKPQTSLHDPHLARPGRIPESVAGSGISPSGIPGGLPHQYQAYSIESELQDLLKAIPSSVPGAQLPFSGSTLPYSGPSPSDHASSFYFLNSAMNGVSRPSFDVNRARQDFPILKEQVNGRPLIWLDNAATTQKPRQVIERLSYFYEHENSNIHRAAHELAARATDAYEGARKKVQLFLNAASPNEIVFVRGSTEAINLVAQSWGDQHLRAGDEIVISYLEHHANIVPWQQLAAKKDLRLRVIPVDDDGQIILEEYAKLLGPRTKLVSFTQVSNALGTVTPAKIMVEMAHQAGAKVLVDGAQAVSHMRADVQNLNSDWYVFSGHKVFGPTGIGILHGKEELLNATQPWQGGGNMIADVTFEQTKYQQAPSRLEAGTGNIADAVGLGAAIDYVNKIGIDAIGQYEHYLLEYATGLLKDIPGLRLIGTAKDKAGVLSFVLDGFRTEEVGSALSREGIAVRSGHHCAQPILRRFGVESTVRPSLALYNTCTEIDTLANAVRRLKSGHHSLTRGRW
jgi:cysteine desulfurase/selenocysteine lyase